MKAMFDMLAPYNAWANRRLYAAVGELSDADYRADLRAAFGSVAGTLNHLLAADRVWLARFRGEPSPYRVLDPVIADGHDDLLAERERTDGEIASFVADLTDERLTAHFTYVPITIPTPVTQPLAPALLHFFNHQTHHRGQTHALLTRLTGKAPPLDLLYFQRETGIGMA